MPSLTLANSLRATITYSPFSPASLFSGGAPGVWYDPSDYPTLFQDSAGTTPVTAVEQPVGLMLDKSQGLVLGPELVVNGDFSNGSTGWILSAGVTVSGGTANWTALASNFSARQLDILTVGKTYQVTYTISSISSGGFKVSIGAEGPIYTSAGTYTARLTASSTQISILSQGAPTTGSIDNISVRELPGNHAFQSTSASRPVLSARYNLLTKTEQFDDAVWAKSGVTVSANTQETADPIGGNTADKLLETSAAAVHYVDVTTGINVVNGAVYTRSVSIKYLGRQWVVLDMYDTATRYTYFDLQNGVVGTNAAGTTATIVSQGNGWYICTISRTVAAATIYIATLTAQSDGGSVSFAGDTTKGIYVWGASLVPANQSTLPYQRVNTSTDYATTGFLPYLKFDGVDDSLSTNSISFTSTDKMSVFAGVRHMNTAATGAVFETSADAGANAGTIALYANTTSYSWRSGGSVRVTATASVTPPLTNVATGLGDISGDLATLRLNGTQVAQNTGDQGTGNYGNYPLYIGRRNNATLPFNGQMYSMIIVGKQVTATELSSSETYTAAKTGVTLA